MPMVLPEGLAPEVYPLAWLVGRWRGRGVIDHPATGTRSFVQDLEFSHDGGPYLAYHSTVRVVADVDQNGLPADSGEEPEGTVWSTESGFWRVAVGSQDVQVGPDQQPLEVLIADPSGFVTVYLGAVGNGRVDLVSDLVARTSTGAEVTAATRMYGLVRGDLLWAWDLAAFGHPMRSYASAQLSRKEA